MEHKLEIYIKENEDLRKILLAQEGGIMKYWTVCLGTTLYI